MWERHAAAAPSPAPAPLHPGWREGLPLARVPRARAGRALSPVVPLWETGLVSQVARVSSLSRGNFPKPPLHPPEAKIYVEALSSTPASKLAPRFWDGVGGTSPRLSLGTRLLSRYLAEYINVPLSPRAAWLPTADCSVTALVTHTDDAAWP